MVEIRKIMEGPTKVHGTVVPINTLKSKFMALDCVFYISRVERRKYTNTGFKGKGSWDNEMISEDKEAEKFYLEDETGKVLVNLKNTDIQYVDIENVPTGQAGYSLVIGSIQTANQDSKKEMIIRPGSNLYVYGFAKKEGSEFVIGSEQDVPTAASVNTENDLTKNLNIANMFLGIVGVIFILVGSIFFLVGLLVTVGAILLMTNSSKG
ncbi:hypothetical protein HY989_03360 [Candidatus Micrarchaeota archaeon]|nr:hypothetical protein [Candidatus Micrarchaeota archaeon]